MREQILEFVSKFLKKKKSDWVSYSGDNYDENEYISAIETLMDGWLVFGPRCREFEKKFSQQLCRRHGIYTNSGR